MTVDPNGARRTWSGALLDFIDRVLGTLSALGTVIGAVLVLATTAVVGYSVALRYLFNQPQVWTDELVGYWLVAMVLLGAADTLRRDGHIGIDLVTTRFGWRGRYWAELWGMVSVVVVAAVLAYGGWEMMMFSHMVGLLSEGYLEAPMWIPQSVVPIGSGLLGLAALHRLVRRLREGGSEPLV